MLALPIKCLIEIYQLLALGDMWVFFFNIPRKRIYSCVTK